jgi:hypothetical protein
MKKESKYDALKNLKETEIVVGKGTANILNSLSKA